MTNIKQLQDIRTREQYQQNCEAGFYNQEAVVDALRREYNLEVNLTSKEIFKTTLEDIRSYQPDAYIIQGQARIPIEIKVTTWPIGEQIDLKKNQIDICAKNNFLLLYANHIQFALINPSSIVNKWGPAIMSNKIHKLCYRVPAMEFNWKQWSTPLVLKEYKR